MVKDSILKKTEFDVKDKNLAEFVAFSNNKTIFNVGGKLALTSSDDITKKIMTLYKAGNYIEANALLKSSESTLDQKKYLENLLSNKNYSFRFSTTPYLKLVNEAIKQKSNVSTILKKKLCNKIKDKLETTDVLSKQKEMILKTVENFEKGFKEKEWSNYCLFEVIREEIDKSMIQEHYYESACLKKIIEEFKKDLEKMNLNPEEIKEVIDFYFFSENAGNIFSLNTSVSIINDKKLIVLINISFGTHAELLKCIDYEDMIPSGKKIYYRSRTENVAFDIDNDSEFDSGCGLSFLNYNLKYELPLSELLLIKDNQNYYDIFKNKFFNSKITKNIKEPESIDEIKKVISIKMEHQLNEIIFRYISDGLSMNSNVITFSAPVLLPIIYQILTGKKLNE
ncbi:MAG: hypothetical protein KAS11_01065 [Candidatus Aenigmarchaeota archaeon]|nr:hypothetical protein [Candidatus Aenigmarchaeota archaeon]